MKRIRIASLCLTLALLLGACGQAVTAQPPAAAAPVTAVPNEAETAPQTAPQTAQTPDMQALYEEIAAAVELPELVSIPEKRREALLGIEDADVAQVVTMICGDSVRADEIWLVEAVDEAAAERVAELAKFRLEQRAQEMENYLPDQYEIVKQAKLLREGRFVALLISPDAETMEALFEQAVKG